MVEYQKKHILLTGTQAEWLARRAETDGRTEAETLRGSRSDWTRTAAPSTGTGGTPI